MDSFIKPSLHKSDAEKQKVLNEKDTKVDLSKVISKRRWWPFKIVLYKASDDEHIDRQETSAYIDVSQIESFYEVFDELRSEKSVIIELETGSTFRVLNTLEEVYAIVNG